MSKYQYREDIEKCLENYQGQIDSYEEHPESNWIYIKLNQYPTYQFDLIKGISELLDTTLIDIGEDKEMVSYSEYTKDCIKYLVLKIQDVDFE